jgi:hypothetical protein
MEPRAEIAKIANPKFVLNGLDWTVFYSGANAVPNDLFAFGRDAQKAHAAGCFLASITMAAALVELIINKDPRTRSRSGWNSLNESMLRRANSKGLPVCELLESADNLDRQHGVRFVELRNHVAHGNLAGIVQLSKGGALDYSSEARALSLKHLGKASRFEVAWYNSSPHVQNGATLGRRWPE